MTYESDLAKEVGYRFECKKDAFSQLTSGTMKIVLTMQPDDMPIEFIKDAMGQRYMAVLVPLNDDETPRISQEPVQKPKSYAGAAKMMAKDPLFKECYKEDDGEAFIRRSCGVLSCAEFVEGTEAGNNFKLLQREFNNWKRARQQEEHYKR